LLPLDKAEVVRQGEDVTILTSRMRHHVLLQAVKTLESGLTQKLLILYL